MNEITIPYHLAIPSFISIAGLLFISIKRKSLFERKKQICTSTAVFLCVYLFIVGSATYHDIYYQWDLNRYDLNKDGMFGGAELTAKQTEAMNRLTNDTGRYFSYITGLVFALIISTVVFITGLITKRVKQK